jgi:hypothetical protein
VRRVDSQRARDLFQRGCAVVTVDDRHPRQTRVRIGVVPIQLEHVLQRGGRVGPVVLLEQHVAPVEVGCRAARIGADRVAQHVVRVLPVAIEPRGGRDRQQVGRLRARDGAGVPVGVADVDQRRQRVALADRFVEAHERVAQRQVVGVGGVRRLQPLARLGVQPEGYLGARAHQQ